jgi:hypothetical protein
LITKHVQDREIDEGAVLVIDGEYKGRVGFYCLHNELTYDLSNMERCPDCKLSKDYVTSITSNASKEVTQLGSPIEMLTGSYCEAHKKILQEHDMAVIYWDRPNGDDYSLVHPSQLVPIPSTEYARYKKECQKDVLETLLILLKDLPKKEGT